MPILGGHPFSWPQTPRPAPLPWLVSALLVGALAPPLGQALLAMSTSLFAENGLIETAQALLLALAALGFLRAYAGATDAKALFCAGMSALSLLALQREIPACESAFFDSGLCLHRTVKLPLSAALVAGACLLALLKRPRWASFLDLRNLAWVWPVGVAALLLGLAEGAEHLHHQEMEETMEFGAYAYLLSFSVWMARTPPTHHRSRPA